MPLPFLKFKKKDASVIVHVRNPEKDNENSGLLVAARELITGMHNNDERAVAAAFKAAFEILELEPHDEINHENQIDTGEK